MCRAPLYPEGAIRSIPLLSIRSGKIISPSLVSRRQSGERYTLDDHCTGRLNHRMYWQLLSIYGKCLALRTSCRHMAPGWAITGSIPYFKRDRVWRQIISDLKRPHCFIETWFNLLASPDDLVPGHLKLSWFFGTKGNAGQGHCKGFSVRPAP